MTVLIRALSEPLEVADDGRTVIGRIAPYGRPAVVDDRDGRGPYRELFERGCFKRPMSARAQVVKLNLLHMGPWVGRGEAWDDQPDGLSMSFRLDDTPDGNTARYKLLDGQVPALSVGFVPGITRTRQGPDGPVEHRVTVRALDHVALVPAGAHDHAVVTAVRNQTADRIAFWQEWLDEQHRP